MRIAPLFAVAALLAPLPAFAHADLVSAAPAANATSAPTSRIQLVFSERVVQQFTGADVAMTSMPGMRMNAPTAVPGRASLSEDGKTLVVTFARPLAAGSYRVAWHAAAADGHREQGNYSFKVQ